MRILHVGFGFRPWIINGLVIYGETLMEAQARAGHEVGYFFPARQLPILRRPFLHRWSRRDVRMFELVNSTLVVGRHRGSPDPARELSDPTSEIIFVRVLSAFEPDLLHIHDLGGLPSSVIDLARVRGIPIVVTVHDYEPLCPTIKLVDAHDRICLRDDPGDMCAVCCADAPEDNGVDLERTLAYARARIRGLIPGLDRTLRTSAGERAGVAAITAVQRWTGGRSDEAPPPPPLAAPGPNALSRPRRAAPESYQHRREVNATRLSAVDALVVSSRRSAEIWAQLGVRGPSVHLIPVTPPHLDRLHPREPAAPGPGVGSPRADPIPVERPLRLATLNAASSTQKGSELLVHALTLLSERGLDHRYHLTVHGWVSEAVRGRLDAHPAVTLAGPYELAELDRRLDDADVGLMPSMWEEVYGFAALELLAKGIPVIGNDIGAIPEYVVPGQTGWLNHSRTASGLADLIERAISRPEEVARLRTSLRERRKTLIPPFAEQMAAMAVLYEAVVSPPG